MSLHRERNDHFPDLRQHAAGFNEMPLMVGVGHMVTLMGWEEECQGNVLGIPSYLTITNPYRSEILKGKNDKLFEVIYYVTDVKNDDNAITDDELTPLIFDNGKLIGWGWSFLEDNIKPLGIYRKQTSSATDYIVAGSLAELNYTSASA